MFGWPGKIWEVGLCVCVCMCVRMHIHTSLTTEGEVTGWESVCG